MTDLYRCMTEDGDERIAHERRGDCVKKVAGCTRVSCASDEGLRGKMARWSGGRGEKP